MKAEGTNRHLNSNLVRVGISCLAAGLFLTAGCLFEPRDAQNPGEGGTSWIAPDFPQKVFSNLESGLEELSGSNYERSIGDNFDFVPLDGDRNQFLDPPVFEDWDKATEIKVMRKLLAGASKVEVVFNPPKTIIDESDFTQYETIYTLVVTSKVNPSHEDTYKGKALFDMKLGGKGYQLVRWEDIEPILPSDGTWGYLRGSYWEP